MDMYISDIHVSIPIIKNKLADDVFHGVSDGGIKQKFALYDMPLLEKGIVIYARQMFPRRVTSRKAKKTWKRR